MTVAASPPRSCTVTFRLIAAGADGVTGATPVTARPRPWNWTVGAAAQEPPMIGRGPALCESPGASEVEAKAGAAAAPDAVAARVASAVPDVCTSDRAGMTVEDRPPPPAPRADRA